MMTFPDTGRFRGIVFITFKTVGALGAGAEGPWLLAWPGWLRVAGRWHAALCSDWSVHFDC